MNKAQKKAIMRLIVVGFLVITSVVILLLKRQSPFWDTLGSLGFGWLFFTPALIDPPPFIPFRRKKAVIFDERDLRILLKATNQAFGAFWYVFPILCIFLYLFVNIYRTEDVGTISSSVLTIIAGGGSILITLVQSLSILIQYHQRSGNGDK
jgi:hypothetical protein